jgi:hypothetical protein
MHRASAIAQGFRPVVRRVFALQANRAASMEWLARGGGCGSDAFVVLLGCGAKDLLRNLTGRAEMIWHQFRARGSAKLP